MKMIELPEVLTKEKLNISTDGVACQDDANRWSHLSAIQVPGRINAEVELLIGQDVPEALEPSEIRSLRGNGPYATKTKFSWTLNGPYQLWKEFGTIANVQIHHFSDASVVGYGAVSSS